MCKSKEGPGVFMPPSDTQNKSELIFSNRNIYDHFIKCLGIYFLINSLIKICFLILNHSPLTCKLLVHRRPLQWFYVVLLCVVKRKNGKGAIPSILSKWFTYCSFHLFSVHNDLGQVKCIRFVKQYIYIFILKNRYFSVEIPFSLHRVKNDPSPSSNHSDLEWFLHVERRVNR